MKEKILSSKVMALFLSILWLCINYYIYYPAINIQNTGFWNWLLVHSVIVSLIFIFCGIAGRSRKVNFKKGVKDNVQYFVHGMGRVQLVLLVVIPVFCLLVLFFGRLAGAQLFNAKKYANLITVEQRDFTTDIKESESVENIALMDTASARIFGDRKIGSLSDVVSQFEVEWDYTQINISNKPMKVTNLKYADFFKYMSNRDAGIPGYIMVNPVDSTAKYVKLEQGMKYVPSGYFNDNIYRYVQMHYPTKIFDGCYFEVKDDGTPCYVCPVLHARIGLFGGMDVKGAVLCEPVSGQMEYYDLADIPAWVDRVYDGELLEDKFNWYGNYSHGFWNSMVGQKGCVKTTDDYGYKTIEDDVWMYTGVTSVTGDASNVGFVMINQRTSEARYYAISGAEEYSAMASAEGEVQEKHYKASFPSLINVDGTPTYIMVLTDNGGLVKMYAMVNVEQYNIVVTAETQGEVFTRYRKRIAQEEGMVAKEEEDKEFIVADMQYIVVEGETYVYLKDGEGNVYKQKFSEDESIIQISVGERIMVQYEKQENGIYKLISFERRTPNVPEESESTIPKNEPEESEGIVPKNKPEEPESIVPQNEPEESEGIVPKNKPEESESIENAM